MRRVGLPDNAKAAGLAYHRNVMNAYVRSDSQMCHEARLRTLMETRAQGTETTLAPVPSAPRADPEQSGRDRLVSELKHTVRQAEQSRSLAPLRGQWTTGHVILRLGDTSADTLREAAEEWIEEEEEWEGGVETPQYEEPPDGSQVVTGAEDDEEWDNGLIGVRMSKELTEGYTIFIRALHEN
ncbi:hypothetical protein NDU88_004986 [Pleurodeles waltl]|uniref:Uncharacterized protein n=1 Tax=Pleurodeles waltl TaxID=8319 RepID=A0AAV7KZX0_PLEWA|nr:hypothetical protein NDU88_004986 [Pleurodeles waltl]